MAKEHGIEWLYNEDTHSYEAMIDGHWCDCVCVCLEFDGQCWWDWYCPGLDLSSGDSRIETKDAAMKDAEAKVKAVES